MWFSKRFGEPLKTDVLAQSVNTAPAAATENRAPTESRGICVGGAALGASKRPRYWALLQDLKRKTKKNDLKSWSSGSRYTAFFSKPTYPPKYMKYIPGGDIAAYPAPNLFCFRI